MATASSSATAVLAAPDPVPDPSHAALTTESDPNVAPNGSVTAPTDPAVHPGLRLDMRTNNGAQRDGRVRNPIPSKLKGKTDEKKGNFNVMHMDITNRTESQARYDAAKRSSESTALQAKLAETDHYVSHHRRANYTRPKPPRTSTAHPPSVTTPEDAAAAVAPPPPPPPAAPASAPVSAPAPAPVLGNHLSSEETKAEQARLLTLLRTLPHANIVDQLCKALAFFGGIPDAPPPQDGKFPESAEANGSGSLFVGWIAEIFPDLDRPPRPVITLSAPPKRPRGRPKGSKATKARRDKGLKKGAKGADGSSSAAPGEVLQNADDDTWVDVDNSVIDVDGPEDTVEDRVLNLLSTPPSGQAVGATGATPATGSSTGFTSINHGAGELGSATKRRGRPKGSKNRPKDANSQETPQQGQPALITTAAGNVPIPTPTITNSTAPTTESSSKKKSNNGRPKASKPKSKIANDSTTQSTATTQQTAVPQPQTSTSYIPPPTLPLAATRPSAAGPSQSPAVNGGSKNKRTQLPAQSVPPVQASQPSTPQVKESTIVGAKRKRQSNKNAGTASNTDANSNSAATGLIASQPASSTTPVMNSGSILPVQVDQVDLVSGPNSASGPPAKRARKSNAANSKRQSTTSAGADASSSSASTDYTPTHQAAHSTGAIQNHTQSENLDAHFEPFSGVQNRNDQNQTYTNRQQNQQQHNTAGSSGQTTLSAPAEGLDAHLERFTTLQNRQQSTQQNNNARQQQSTQLASPTPSQSSKVPQVASLHSQQQVRTTSNAPNYYPHNQTPSYTMQQGSSYATNQRQPQNTSTSSPGTALVSQVTHSPQFGSQSNNSPLLNTDNTFRGSPSLGYAPRRTPSASPMDSGYRSTGVSNQSSHFGSARQAPASSHAGVPASFGSFSDPNFLDIQAFDSSGNQNSIGMNNAGASYTLGSGNVQRTNSGSNAASAYANAALTNGAYDSTGLNKGAMNANYRGPARWS